MDTNQPTPAASSTTTTATTIPPVYTAPPGGMFGSKIPSVTGFAIGLLLFLMPFIDIKCNGVSLQQVKGLELATGFEMKKTSSNPYLDDIKTEGVDREVKKATTKTDKKEANLYAMIALGLGALGLILSFTNVRAAVGGAAIAGVAATGAMVGLMLDVKKKVKMDLPDMSDKTPDNDVGNTVDKIGSEIKGVTDKLNISVDFTPWFYIAALAFLVAAFFCYRRLTAKK
jgi:hypothetical protein